MASPERRERFEREAKSVAALNHPNIVQVFSVEEADGIHFIVMELVRGKTLTELLSRNGMPLSKFFEMAIPLADAVAAAHGAAITRRDLKPDNVILGDDGRIKVLDFGLAKPAPAFAEVRTIAYAASTSGDLQTGNTDIWVTQLGGGSPANRTPDHDGRDSFPSWSPDGTRIAFWSDRDGGGYFLMSAVGGPSQRVVPARNPDGPAAWSPDGMELACIVSDGDRVFLDVVSVSTLEVERTLLTQGGYLGREPAMDSSWSPDGKLLAYVAGNRSHVVTTLRVFRFADEQTIDLTDGQTKVWSPVWADTSRGLFYLSNREASMDLWHQPLTVDGIPVGKPVPITVGIGMQRAAFSPDGTKLAYSVATSRISGACRFSPIVWRRGATRSS